MIIFLIFINLFAQNVVIQAEETTHFEYQKHLSENPTHMSYIQHIEGQPNHLSQKVLEELKKAQFEFLNGSLVKAEQHFANIVDLSHKANWKHNERKAIHFSLLRLAQLTKDNKKQNEHLTRAAVFSPNLSIDTNIFPPPLVDKYKSLLQNIKSQVWPLPNNSEKFDKVLVNGKLRRENTSFIELPNHTHRIQFLSNRYLPVHLIVKPQDLEILKLSVTPLASGPCQAPTFNETLNQQVDFYYKKLDCTGKRNSFSQPIETYNNTLASTQTTSPKNSLYKSKWFWIGLSVLATGALIAHQQNRRKESPSIDPRNDPNPPPDVQVFTNQ